MALALKHRPTTIEDFVGNRQTALSINALLQRSTEDIQHSWLFTGPSGCGKTTLGRIVAAKLGCVGDDFVEVDSADFRGIDTIRDIRRNMHFLPLQGPCRVWLLDECHKLSGDGQTALLKALEDTPPHVYFILATTDPQKLLPTIKNRCVHFEVVPLEDKELLQLLRDVCSAERKRIPPEVLNIIVRDSLGSSRAALQVLDKIIDLPVDEMLKAAESAAAAENQVIDLCRALMDQAKWKTICKILDGLETAEVETIRKTAMNYCASILRKEDNPQAWLIMDSLKNDFFLNGRAGLIHALYEALEAGKS